MTEAQWLPCTNPRLAVDFLRGKVSSRQVRLLGCAWCRSVWPLLVDSRSRGAIEVAERFEGGHATAAELTSARLAAQKADTGPEYGAEREAAWAVTEVLWPDPSLNNIASAITTAIALSQMASSPRSDNQGFELMILWRDIFGNPFRPVVIDPGWRAWNDATVVRLVEVIYAERHLPSGHLDAGRLAILADALEDAGCQDAGILDHCRSEQVHLRGCHVLDAILAKS